MNTLVDSTQSEYGAETKSVFSVSSAKRPKTRNELRRGLRLSSSCSPSIGSRSSRWREKSSLSNCWPRHREFERIRSATFKQAARWSDRPTGRPTDRPSSIVRQAASSTIRNKYLLLHFTDKALSDLRGHTPLLSFARWVPSTPSDVVVPMELTGKGKYGNFQFMLAALLREFREVA